MANDAITYGFLTDEGFLGPVSLGVLRRALTIGGMAFDAEAKRDDAALEQAFAKAHVVFVLWPDEQSACGFSFMPAKRSPGEESPDKIDVVAEVLPCENREAAFALQRRFGDAALIEEFKTCAMGNNIVPFPRR